MTHYSFCETMHATGPWHIRELTSQGKKLGGGADTKTLCGLQAAWDVQCEFSESTLDRLERMVPRHELGSPCKACSDKYREVTRGRSENGRTSR